MTQVSFLLALAALPACDPGYSLTGTLIDSSGAPVSGATITAVCPRAADRDTVSAPTGAFSFGGVGPAQMMDGCSLRIDSPGRATKRLPATAACFRSTQRPNRDAPCAPGEGTIEVVP